MTYRMQIASRTYRYTRDPAPMRLTLVNCIPTFEPGEFACCYPGAFIEPESGEKGSASAFEFAMSAS